MLSGNFKSRKFDTGVFGGQCLVQGFLWVLLGSRGIFLGFGFRPFHSKSVATPGRSSRKYYQRFVNPNTLNNHDLFNSPYACFRQMSKFHHPASFWNFKVAEFCTNKFRWKRSWKEYPRSFTQNAKNFCLETKLDGEICSCDVIHHKGHCKTISWKI